MIVGIREGTGEGVIVGGTVAMGCREGKTVAGEQLPARKVEIKNKIMRCVIANLFLVNNTLAFYFVNF